MLDRQSGVCYIYFKFEVYAQRRTYGTCLLYTSHRGEEISTAVFEAHADEIFTEAENRLHVQKAVLAVLLAGK